MSYKWSVFTVTYVVNEGEAILKNFLTGAVVKLQVPLLKHVNGWLKGLVSEAPNFLDALSGKNGLIVPIEKDEFAEYQWHFLETRNMEANLFTLHFLPTLLCQFSCSCCFERGGKKIRAMTEEVLNRSVDWVKGYLEINPEVKHFKCALFGGEPLLEKRLIALALSKLSLVVGKAGVEFWTEITTNGELLDKETASMLARYDWRRVQVTLDGNKETHDQRRCGPGHRPTFDTIISNVRMVLDSSFVNKVNLRLSLDEETAGSLPDLIHFLANLGYGQRIELSLGLTVPTLDNQKNKINEDSIAHHVILAWKVAKECGFEVPEEFLVGPWCVAVAKHSAVLQPDGNIQKCFCTVGRPNFNFANVFDQPTGYAQDSRFEEFSRTDRCIAENCPYLPVCGGGCIHDSLVKNGVEKGFHQRFCQRRLLAKVNEGLVLLKYE